MVISIHAPPRGATYRRFNRRKSRQSKCISIHAPPRGATCTVWIQRILSAISIHAPPRGATYAVYYVCILPNYFNSRPSARGDDSYMGAVCAKRGFQFTPLREGRRARLRVCSAAQSDFNSRPSARGDNDFDFHNEMVVLFQFTPLREGRLTASAGSTTGNVFQFTPLREGRHARWGVYLPNGGYFNSRPSARGDLTAR